MMDSDVFINPRLDNNNSVSLHLPLMSETLSAEAAIVQLLCSGARASSDKESGPALLNSYVARESRPMGASVPQPKYICSASSKRTAYGHRKDRYCAALALKLNVSLPVESKPS